MNTFQKFQMDLNATPILRHSTAHHLINGFIPFLFFWNSFPFLLEGMQTYHQSGKHYLFQDKRYDL